LRAKIVLPPDWNRRTRAFRGFSSWALVPWSRKNRTYEPTTVARFWEAFRRRMDARD